MIKFYEDNDSRKGENAVFHLLEADLKLSMEKMEGEISIKKQKTTESNDAELFRRPSALKYALRKSMAVAMHQRSNFKMTKKSMNTCLNMKSDDIKRLGILNNETYE